MGRLCGEVNHDCLGAVVADSDVILKHTGARRSGSIARGGTRRTRCPTYGGSRRTRGARARSACGARSRCRAAVTYALTYNMTSIPTDASRAYYREGVVGAPGKLVVLRIYRYRYDELVRVVSYGLGEGLPKRTPAIGDYGPV